MKPKIIIYSTPVIVSGNMEFIHYEFAEQLNNEGFEVIFWGVAHASKRINSKYKIVNHGIISLLLYSIQNRKNISYLFAPASLAVHGFKLGCIGRLIGLNVVTRVTSNFPEMVKYSSGLIDFFKRVVKFKLLAPLALKLSNKVIVPKFSRHHFIKKKKFEVVMCSRFESNSNTRQDKSVSSGRVLFVGNLVHEKNLNELRLIADSGVYIDVLGDGPLVKKLSHPNISVYGRVDEYQVKDFITNSSALILLSLIGGDFYPNVVIEAISLGTPVVSRDHATDYGSIGVTIYDNIEQLLEILRLSEFKTPNYVKRKGEFKKDLRKVFAENIYIQSSF